MSYAELLFFSGFLVLIIGMLLLDLGVFSKKHHVVTFKEAATWSAIWVTVAISFYFFLSFQGHWIHGIQDLSDLKLVSGKYIQGEEILVANDFQQSLSNYNQIIALQFITGYLLEYSLSVDNIFVIILIFSSFGVREKYFKKVLFWGILGAIVMRFLFIFLGSALIQQFHWILYVFGGFLIFSGAKIFFEGDDEELDPNEHWVVKLTSKYLNVFPRYLGDRFFILKNGVFMITPLFVVVIIIEFTDLIFAVDSVPAVFAVTKDPFVVFFSNIFAILGLRSMFFFLSNIMHLFRFLKVGLAFLLVFIGFKMVTFEWLLQPIGFKSYYSLWVILGILAVSVIASLIFPKKEEEATPPTKVVPETEFH